MYTYINMYIHTREYEIMKEAIIQFKCIEFTNERN